MVVYSRFNDCHINTPLCYARSVFDHSKQMETHRNMMERRKFGDTLATPFCEVAKTRILRSLEQERRNETTVGASSPTNTNFRVVFYNDMGERVKIIILGKQN